jgi:hypothetical protein
LASTAVFGTPDRFLAGPAPSHAGGIGPGCGARSAAGVRSARGRSHAAPVPAGPTPGVPLASHADREGADAGCCGASDLSPGELRSLFSGIGGAASGKGGPWRSGQLGCSSSRRIASVAACDQKGRHAQRGETTYSRTTCSRQNAHQLARSGGLSASRHIGCAGGCRGMDDCRAGSG